MAHIRGSIVINRPVTDVFDFVADEEHEPLFNQQMESARRTSAGPLGVGSTFHAVMNGVGGRTELDITFVEFVRPSRLASLTNAGGMEIYGALTFAPEDGATRMEWNWDIRPHGIMSAFGPVITWQGRRQEERIWHALKQYLEAAPAR